MPPVRRRKRPPPKESSSESSSEEEIIIPNRNRKATPKKKDNWLVADSASDHSQSESEVEEEIVDEVSSSSDEEVPPKQTRKSVNNNNHSSDEENDESEEEVSEEESSSEPGIYEVESILDKQISSTGIWIYRIRWKGYGEKDDTWEPKDNLTCDKILAKFEKEWKQKQKEEEQPEKKPEKSKEKSKEKQEKKEAKSSENKTLIETILGKRKNKDKVDEFLVKPKNRSCLYVEWVTKEEADQKFSNAKFQLTKYLQNETVDESSIEDAAYFPADYTLIDRIVEISRISCEEKVIVIGERYGVLVKWKLLGYEEGECTYEPKEILEEKVANYKEKLKFYKKINSKEALEEALKPVPLRPKQIKLDQLKPPYKDPKLELRDYQLEGFRWLVHSWVSHKNTILADEMGLGKTIQVAITLQYIYRAIGIRGPFLVVGPLSTVENWKRELEKWTDLNCIIFRGNEKARKLIKDTEFYFDKQTNSDGDKIYKFNVVITTEEMIKTESALKGIQWQYLVVDEGHRMKNDKSKIYKTLIHYKSEHKLILTGTPLQNQLVELWTLLHFLEPTVFGDKKTFLKEFEHLENPQVLSTFNELINPYLLRRKKEDVDDTIPQKEETLVEVALTAIQKTYYKAVLEKNMSILTKGGIKRSLLNIVMELRKCCNHPYLIAGVETTVRNEIERDNEKFKSEQEKTIAMNLRLIKSSSKFLFMEKLLERLRKNGTRVLVFSQLVMMLDLLETFMKIKGYPYERLDGSVKASERQASIDRFSDPKIDKFVFLLGTRAGGLGINLTIATTVIIFDSDWNPQNDIQAQARCHRIGQREHVKVYRLITKNTYEKRMFEIASKKLGLEQVVLGGVKKTDNPEAGIANAMSSEEVEKVLRYGAYAMYDNTEVVDDTEMDIDQILAKSKTIAYTGETSMQNSLFSKAVFGVSKDDMDVHDPEFWMKVFTNSSLVIKLQEMLKRPDLIWQDPQRRESVIQELGNLIADIKSETPTYTKDEARRVFDKVYSFYANFTPPQQSMLDKWETEFKKRSRKSLSKQLVKMSGNADDSGSDYDSDEVEEEESEEEEFTTDLVPEEEEEEKKKKKSKLVHHVPGETEEQPEVPKRRKRSPFIAPNTVIATIPNMDIVTVNTPPRITTPSNPFQNINNAMNVIHSINTTTTSTANNNNNNVLTAEEEAVKRQLRDRIMNKISTGSKYFEDTPSPIHSSWPIDKMDGLLDALGSFGMYRWVKLLKAGVWISDAFELELMTYNLISHCFNKDANLFVPLNYPPKKNLVDYLARDVERILLAPYNPSLKPYKIVHKQKAVIAISANGIITPKALLMVSVTTKKNLAGCFLRSTLPTDTTKDVPYTVGMWAAESQICQITAPAMSGLQSLELVQIKDKGDFMKLTIFGQIPMHIGKHLAFRSFEITKYAFPIFAMKIQFMWILNKVGTAHILSTQDAWNKAMENTKLEAGPAPWWKRKDDRALMAAYYRNGYGNFVMTPEEVEARDQAWRKKSSLATLPLSTKDLKTAIVERAHELIQKMPISMDVLAHSNCLRNK